MKVTKQHGDDAVAVWFMGKPRAHPNLTFLLVGGTRLFLVHHFCSFDVCYMERQTTSLPAAIVPSRGFPNHRGNCKGFQIIAEILRACWGEMCVLAPSRRE